MTLPDERYRALRYVREFLYDLLDPKKTPKVPRAVRLRARSVLKHYPTPLDVDYIVQGKRNILENPDSDKDDYSGVP